MWDYKFEVLVSLALKILEKLTKLNAEKLKELFTDEELASVLSSAFEGINESKIRVERRSDLNYAILVVFTDFFSDERTIKELRQVFGGDSDSVDFYLLEKIFIETCDNKHLDIAGINCFDAIYGVIKGLEALLKKDENLAKTFTFSGLDNVYGKLEERGATADDPRVLLRYLRQFKTFNNRLQFHGVPDMERRIEGPLQPLFVMPRVRDGSRSVTFDNLLHEKKSQRLVVLGKPGSGKTVLSRFILVESANRFLENHRESEPVGLPILIEIRKLDRYLGKNPDNCIVDYLYDSIRSDYNLTLPKGFFENYLDNGKVLVVFDGLDEVLDEGRRKNIRDMIVNFSASYRGKNTIVVTSRIVGYDRTPVSSNEYLQLTLEDFNDEEIERFLLQWFRNQAGESAKTEGGAEELKNIITANTSIMELARNPMFLMNTCIIHRDGFPLPLDRFVLYEKVTHWILSIWDNQKNIGDDKFKLEDKRRYLEKIAFHIQSYKKEKKRANVISRDELDKILIPEFVKTFSCDTPKARLLVGDFLDKIGVRTGILVEVGPGIYSFAYAALLEYFAAQWIANEATLSFDLKLMINYVDQYIDNASWHEVLILALRTLPQKQGGKVLEHIFKSRKIPSFYVKSIAVENVKCFKGKHFLNLSHSEKPADWTVILGNNGTGKTTLLQCIALLDPLQLKKDTSFASVDKQGNAFDIARFETANLLSQRLTVKFYYNLDDSSPHTKFLVDNIDMIYNHYYDWMKTSGLFAFVVYAYGASRKSGDAALGSSTGDRHANLFEDKDLVNAEEWLMQADYAARKGTGNEAKSKLEKIKKILLDILPDVKGFDFKTADNLSHYVEFLTDYGSVRFKDLSLGYRVMISWVVDLARQMFERYTASDDPLAEPAVVLVDEIDLHLHPSWQRDIIRYLSQHFKKTQFIVTAHSPLIVQSAEPINVVLLHKDTEKGSVSISNEVNVTYTGWTVEEILNDLMGLDKAVSDEYQQLMKKFEKAVYKDDLVTAKKTYDQLDKILHPANHLRKLMRIQMATLGGEEAE